MVSKKAGPRLRRSADPIIRATVISFSLLISGFLVSGGVSWYAGWGIRNLSRQISENSTQAVVILAESRGALFRLEEAADQFTGQHAYSALEGREIWGRSTEVREKVGEYLSFSPSDAEHVLRLQLQNRLKELRDNVEKLISLKQAGRNKDARSFENDALRNSVVDIDRLLENLVSISAEHMADLAASIDRMWTRSLLLAGFLGMGSIVLAATTALFLVRVSRKYTRMVERRAEELEQFAGRVAHDILNPVTGASFACGLVATKVTADRELAEVLRNGKESLESALKIVRSLLEFARAGARPDLHARTEVRSIAERALREYRSKANQFGVTLENYEGDEAVLTIGEGLLFTLFSNLIDNAIKHVGDKSPKRVLVHGENVGERFRVEVEDTGPGIPVAISDVIFEPYVRGEVSGAEGLGLGLATFKRIVESHGGDVGVDSKLGVGSTFWFELPIAPPPEKIVVPIQKRRSA